MPPRSRAPVVPAASEHPTDRAVRTRDPAALPPDQRATCQAVIEAFAAYAAGRDDVARELLSTIGLQSPFLEWRVLLRGLMAHAAGSPTRALENFARLDPGRLPARLAEPLVAGLDPSTPVPAKLSGAVRSLFADPLIDSLGALRKPLGGGQGLGTAFKLLAPLVGPLKLRSPKAERELARLMYHAVRRHGEPKDLAKLKTLFGSYPDDPTFHRLSALAYEESASAREVAKHWLAYEAWLSRSPAGWPPDLAVRARAMALTRAARICAFAQDGAVFSLATPPDPVPLWGRAVELAPGWEPAALDLMKYYLSRNKSAEAEALIRAHLTHAPGALEFLDTLARLLNRGGRAQEALVVRQQHFDAGPLDSKVRMHLARAFVVAARAALLEGEPQQALDLMQAGQPFGDGSLHAARLGLSAIIKRKLKDTRAADADADAARAVPGAKLQVAYTTAVDAGLAKLPPPLKTAANKALVEVLASELTVGEVTRALEALEDYAQSGIVYRGSKAHSTKLIEAATRAIGSTHDEREFEELARVPAVRTDPKLTLKLVPKMRLKFPKNPLLALAEAEALVATLTRPFNPRLIRLLTIAAQTTDPRHEATVTRAKQLLERFAAIEFGDFFA